MKLTFRNVARFYKKAEIEFNGITVIAGKNGTGKSTVGKLLYCIFDSLYDLKGQISKEKYNSISNRIDRYLDTFSFTEDENINTILAFDRDISLNELQNRMSEMFEEVIDEDETAFEEFCKDIYSILNVSENQVKQSLLNYRIAAEFDNQIKNVNFEADEAYIELKLKEEFIRIKVDKDAEYESMTNVLKQVVYVDDLSAISIDSPIFLRRGIKNRFSHSRKLYDLIFRDNKKNVTLIDDIINKDKYKQLVDKMNSDGIGRLSRNSKGVYEYKTDEFKTGISITNVSSGTKIFAILRKLIESACIEENSVIILDEPESHLHPEWQYVLAELIVLMQTKLDMTILISSHSADFVAFIEFFSKRYGITDKAKYYLLSQDKKLKGTSIVKDVTGSTSEIYEILGTKFVEVSEELMDEED